MRFVNEEAASVRLTDSSLPDVFFLSTRTTQECWHSTSSRGMYPWPPALHRDWHSSQQASSTKLDMAAAAMDDSQVHKTANLIVCMHVPSYDSVNLPLMCIRMLEWVLTN